MKMSPTPKKLVYILNYVNERDSQHFVHVLRLLRKMQARGWEIVVLSEKGGRGTQTIMGCEVCYLSEDGGLSRVLRQVREMVRLRREGYRLVFVRITRPAALVSALVNPLLGFSGLFWLSGMVLDFDCERPLLARLNRRIQMRAIINGMKAFVTGPETMIRYYREKLQVPEKKLHLLYNDIDIEAFPPRPHTPEAGAIRLLMVHRLSPVRRTNLYFPPILAAMETLQKQGLEVSLDIVGSGPEVPILEAQFAERLQLVDVTFHGALPNVELNAFFDRASIFLMPSYREGFPRVLIEAMSKGVPVVSTDAGGVRDIVGPQQAAFVSDRDDAGAFAENLKRLARNAEARDALREENLREVQRFSTEAVSEMFENLLLKVDAASRGAGR